MNGNDTRYVAEGNPVNHDGYIIILNKLARFYSDTREDICRYCDSISIKAKDIENTSYGTYNTHLQSFLTFGDFDRISFNSVDRFSKYYDLDEKSRYWLGKQQFVFLYRIKGTGIKNELYPYADNYNEDTKQHEYGFCIKRENSVFYYSALTGEMTGAAFGKEIFFPFFLLTQISLSNEVITRATDYSIFLKTIKEKLSDKLDEAIRRNKYNVFFDIYGCMNSSEIAILWLCEQYCDVLNLINYLKDFKFEEGDADANNNLFFSFYSVIGRTLTNSYEGKKNLIIVSEETKSKIKEKCKGTAIINITVGDKYNVDALEKIIKDQFKEKENLIIEKTKCLGGEYLNFLNL